MSLITIEPNHPVRAMIRSVRREFVRECNAGQRGLLVYADPKSLLPEKAYRLRERFLRWCDNPDERDITETRYYREQAGRHGPESALAKSRKFAALLKSIREGFYPDTAHAPVAVMDGDRMARRLDGTHRISVLRYLRFRRVPVVAVTESEYAQYALEKFSRETAKNALDKYEKWYQAIEVLPGLWTRSWRDDKEGIVVRALRERVAGKNVVDLGCNDGLYCFEAMLGGAASVLGLDKREETIEQAELVKLIWGITKPPSENVEFRAGHIRSHMGCVNGKDVLVAACVLYHLAEYLHPFLSAVQDSSINTVIVQGNRERAKKSPPELIGTIKENGVTKDTPAKAIYDVPQFEQLLSMYGFKLVEQVPSQWPVAVFER